MDTDGVLNPVEPARRRSPRLLLIATAVLLAVAATVVAWQVRQPGPAGQPAALPSTPPTVDCRSRPVPTPPPARPVGARPTAATSAGAVLMTVTTDLGVIEVEVDRGRTPCTAGFLAFLAGERYYDGTACHRLVTKEIHVLQCGDPAGTGEGGPGFAYDEENLRSASASAAPSVSPSCGGTTVIGDLPEGLRELMPTSITIPGDPGGIIVGPSGIKIDPSGIKIFPSAGVKIDWNACMLDTLPDLELRTYPRGEVGIAKMGPPGTSSAQFFFVYGDSTMTATYTPFGRVVTGMEIIDKVAAGGVSGTGGDGRPRTGLSIQSVTFRPI